MPDCSLCNRPTGRNRRRCHECGACAECCECEEPCACIQDDTAPTTPGSPVTSVSYEGGCANFDRDELGMNPEEDDDA